MDNDLNNIKRAFKNLKNKRLNRCLILTIILLALGLTIFLSHEQIKALLTEFLAGFQRIKRIF